MLGLLSSPNYYYFMKKLLASLLFTFAAYAGFGQENPSENQIKLNVGLATPAGQFSEAEMKGHSAGFAKTGVFLNAGYTRFLNKNFGMGFDIIHLSNPMDEAALFMEAKKLDNGINSVSATSWQSLMSLISLVYSYQIEGSQLHPYLKISGGLAHSTAPKITYENLFNGQVIRQSGTSNSSAFGAGAGLQYQFNNLALGLEATYLYTKPEFTIQPVPTFSQVMNTLNASISVSYIWGRN